MSFSERSEEISRISLSIKPFIENFLHHHTTTMPPTSRQWVSPETLELQRLHRGRMQVCRFSPFLAADFNLAAHKKEWQAAKERLAFRNLSYHMRVIEQRQAEQQRAFPLPPPALRPAFDGKEWSTNHSAVLSFPTVFSTTYWKGRAPETISDWPTKSEMKYEGDDRISTDRLHARFPPAPRVQGNGTVNWQQRTIIVPHFFDNFQFGLNECDIFLRRHWIDELEFSDEEGRVAVGKELMGLIECEDVW